MRFASRRADVPGYLEFIWRADVERPEGVNPQAIAVITDGMSTYRKRTYTACYGVHVVEGSTVSAVKAELFALIEAGQ